MWEQTCNHSTREVEIGRTEFKVLCCTLSLRLVLVYMRPSSVTPECQLTHTAQRKAGPFYLWHQMTSYCLL